MNKKFLILILVIIPLTFVFSQQFFNPFQYGIKTVQEVRIIDNLNFRNEVRERAAQLLNEFYNTSTFKVSGDTIISETGQNVNEAVQNSYGNWENLIKSATDLLLSDCDTLAALGMIEYCHWKTVNVDISGGVLRKIYISPSGYGGPFPRVSPCEKGVGQCLLFFFDRILRILYFGALALGVIFLMWAGILYITKPLEAKNIHQRFIWGILGIIVGITSFTIVIALENWLAGGLTTEVQTGGTVGETVGTAQEGLISIRRIYIDRQEDALYITFDIKPKEGSNYCSITITGKDDTGNNYNIANNLQLSAGTNIEKVFRNLNIPATATELELTFSPGDLICTINPPSYIVKIGQYVAISPAPKIIIDQSTAKIDENKKFSVFVSAEKPCDLTVSFYNLTKGINISSQGPVSISAPQFFSYNIPSDLFDLGDTVRVVFNSSNCEVSVRQLDIRTREIVTTPPTIKKPIIDLTIREITGQQTIYVNIEDLSDLKSILENILGIAVIQRNLYDPPFSMYVTYNVTVDNQSPQNSGSCTIYGRLRGIRINQLSFDKTKAISYTTFNRDFSFTIRYEANREGPYNVPIPLPLPNNLLGFINLELYHYTGACEEVKVNDNNISDQPFNTTYDIETGRFYSPSGNILRDLFGF